MLGDITAADELYIVTGYTDMRKSIDGLCAIVEQQLHMDPRCSALYLFCGKRCDQVKVLLWEISDILNSKSQKQVCQKDRCCPSAKKKDIQLQNLPISKMNCADSTERPLKLPEPVFHCVDIFHHQPDNIDVPSRIPAHEELSGCF